MSASSETYFKLIVTGSVNSGKTTFVKTISEIDAFTTDELATEDDVMKLKELTTVAMDYGRRTIDDDTVLHIYGTPGQDRFDFMWDVLATGAFGTIFLADSTDMESLDKTKEIMEYFRKRYDLPYLLCVTKLDTPQTIGFARVLDKVGVAEIPSIPLKTIDEEDCRNALVTFLTLAIEKEQKNLSDESGTGYVGRIEKTGT